MIGELGPMVIKVWPPHLIVSLHSVVVESGVLLNFIVVELNEIQTHIMMLLVSKMDSVKRMEYVSFDQEDFKISLSYY